MIQKLWIRFCTVLLVALLIGCSCHIGMEPRWYEGNHMELYTMAAFNVIGVDGREKEPVIRILETDDYGRELFCVTFRNPVFYSFYSNDTVENMCAIAYMICQKAEKYQVFYYEDVCYRICKNEGMFSPEERNSLKEQNDWNKPLNDAKMTFRSIIKSNTQKLEAMPLDYDTAFDIDLYKQELFWSLTPKISKDRMLSAFLDCNQQGKSLIVVWSWSSINDYDNNEPDSNLMAYFMMLESDSLQTKKGTTKRILDPDHYWIELHDFKEENGWFTCQEHGGMVLSC